MYVPRQGRIPAIIYSDYLHNEKPQNGLCFCVVIVVFILMRCLSEQPVTNSDEDKLEAVTKVIQTVANENLAVNFNQCLEILKRVLPYGNVEPSTTNYDLRTPALVSWQVEVCYSTLCILLMQHNYFTGYRQNNACHLSGGNR